MIYIVLFFLAVSFLLYVLFAGADFGAGIIELFSSKKNQQITKKTIYRVMGPVWEANHIWIIIMIVILWVGFPLLYNVLMISLHIPLTLVLLGITLRGVAFVFRHYDAFIDKSQIIYDWMFKISSLVTPIFLGMSFGALLTSKIYIQNTNQFLDFSELYISSWLNGFSILVGIFFASLCAFLSSILLIGESEKQFRAIYVKKALISTLVVVIIGFITLCYAYLTNVPFINEFTSNSFTIMLLILSAILLFPLWKSIKNSRRIYSRFFAGLQVVLVLSSAIISIFPNIIYTHSGPINIFDTIAPEKVISILGISLIIGGLVILPGLFHLLKSFKMIKILER